MLKKFSIIFNVIFILFFPLSILNLIASNKNPDIVFPFIFVVIAFLEITLGISCLNNKKSALSISSFLIAGFLLILVGTKIYIYG